MVEYITYINGLSNKTGFIVSTLEKVERLLKILQWINNDIELGNLLVLKGGTAINTAIFNFPRLSVDIDLDININFSKDTLSEKRIYINSLLYKYLNSQGYRIDTNKSKNLYALDSIVATYTDIRGNIDNIKIEINYMLRTHILETKKLKVSTDIFEDRYLSINCVNPIEIYAAKISALISRATARDLFDIYTLSKYDLFDEQEKILLKKCFVLNYIAICGYKINDLNLQKIDTISKQDIKTRLYPTLKDRNPKNLNVEIMKRDVKEYLKSIITLNDEEKLFCTKFNKGIYVPELLFEDSEIIDRITNHPMILWKIQKN